MSMPGGFSSTMATLPVEREAVQAAAPAVTTHPQSSCWQQLAEGAQWTPGSDTGKAGAARCRCVFVFMNV